jgi:hypothetical protein
VTVFPSALGCCSLVAEDEVNVRILLTVAPGGAGHLFPLVPLA